MKLGGAAATKFNGAKSAYEQEDAGNIGYKNSDVVRDFYLNNYRGGRDTTSVSADGVGLSNVPDFWAERQKQRELETLQMGVFSTESTSQSTAITQASTKANDDVRDGVLSAETALVQIATYSLEKMTKSLEGRKDVTIPVKERTEFANALKGAMDALAKIA